MGLFFLETGRYTRGNDSATKNMDLVNIDGRMEITTKEIESSIGCMVLGPLPQRQVNGFSEIGNGCSGLETANRNLILEKIQ